MVIRLAAAAAVAIGFIAAPPLAAAYPTVADILSVKTIDAVVPSPDGTHIAFRILSRSVDDDRTSAQWYLQPVGKDVRPIVLGAETSPTWIPLVDAPERPKAVWLPDSSGLLTIQTDDHGSQLHFLQRTGADRRLTSGDRDAVDFRLGDGGLEVAMGDPWAISREKEAREHRNGVHLDQSVPTEGLRLTGNFWVGSRRTTIRRSSSGGAGEYGATDLTWQKVAVPELPALLKTPPIDSQSAHLISAAMPEGPLDGKVIDLHGATRVRFTALNHPIDGEEEAIEQLEAITSAGTALPCHGPFCAGPASSFRQILFDERTASWIIAYEPDGSGQTQLYSWQPHTDRYKIIRTGLDRLRGGSDEQPLGCPVAGDQMICVDAGPTSPDRLISLDVRSGRWRVLADPNERFENYTLPTVRSLTRIDADGLTTRALLVLPRGAGPFPLVITTYRCRGFLQGATSKLTPEIALAARGIAALCVNNNNLGGHRPDAAGHERFFGEPDAAIATYQGFVQQLAENGIIDARRVGIAGHSFTGNLVGYALARTHMFAAAEIGSGLTVDPNSYSLAAPVADSWRKAAFTAYGLPHPDDDPGHLWASVSPALNAARIDTPLLLQPPEVEYLMALQLFAALDDRHKPVDMYVYPEAGHLVGRSPAQMVSRAERSVDWFSFWLLPSWRSANARMVKDLGWDALLARQASLPMQTKTVAASETPTYRP